MELHTPPPDTIELTIRGMDCADCALNLERSVARLAGVTACEVSFATGASAPWVTPWSPQRQTPPTPGLTAAAGAGCGASYARAGIPPWP